ncbi:acetyl/propionyl/methylcrotonyl-CoA carboxylase subunit alpha [Marinobacter nanhaiticus D15-8W]|uniref:Biotin carboxylase n=1 Tax=Marinobacter nanhaiticus D15-8W TaxID=626887 RepID=N6WSA2_9GAMM|nr:acetyl/propionyl/methylcrotonyl-CoA carboxylase subunit alpha [Marinobacter nanhaiticus]ENO13912.1 acetyl/propionyl/methylcrotonyl-CoA carboxylase subunit alpha [Marinobacter nanhaiticus D15-8W]BES71289.1 acetyl/propionyl/methylcrotonyl-CoA carboxylase subunit alpha [Marinobacter nanhaiticus D15-8W]
MTQHAIQTLLVANRGEIALRIMRTAQQMGIRCIAVYSDADRLAPFVKQADVAVHIGPAAAAESYLKVDRILKAARDNGADAIHPGYGFLSENTALAEQCEAEGIRFIGPPASAIAAMGSKSAAKALIAEAGVPLVPGYHGDDQSLERFREEAEKTGFPMLIKASAGGGGKGMRVVRSDNELEDAIAAAQREASSSFGDPHLLMERYLENPRHVEVQVMFDSHGKGRYLFDRDCSVQRRHQKIIEEAPAPGLPPAVRKAMGEAAVRCGEAIGYVGAGTVEFLYEPGGYFYFMEMNTRLQVEHPVTELITGLDLVEWQIRVANGEHLPWAQDDLEFNGHAMEARVYAEDPDNDFLPVTGRLHYLHEPSDLPHVRVDSGVAEGLEVTPWYDPMLAKVITWGEDRTTARTRLIEALDHYEVLGVTLNNAFVSRVLRHPDFAAADLTTHFIEKHQDALSKPDFDESEQLALSWLAWQQATLRPQASGPWSLADSFRLGGPRQQRCEIRIGDTGSTLMYELTNDREAHLILAPGTPPLRLSWQSARNDQALNVQIGGRRVRLSWASHGEKLGVFADSNHWLALVNHPEEQLDDAESDGHLTAPMHGRVIALNCAEGDRVEAGKALVVMEAMKMEHSLKAPAAGRIVAVHCENGASVSAGQVLVDFEAEDNA